MIKALHDLMETLKGEKETNIPTGDIITLNTVNGERKYCMRCGDLVIRNCNCKEEK